MPEISPREKISVIKHHIATAPTFPCVMGRKALERDQLLFAPLSEDPDRFIAGVLKALHVFRKRALQSLIYVMPKDEPSHEAAFEQVRRVIRILAFQETLESLCRHQGVDRAQLLNNTPQLALMVGLVLDVLTETVDGWLPSLDDQGTSAIITLPGGVEYTMTAMGNLYRETFARFLPHQVLLLVSQKVVNQLLRHRPPDLEKTRRATVTNPANVVHVDHLRREQTTYDLGTVYALEGERGYQQMLRRRGDSPEGVMEYDLHTGNVLPYEGGETPT
ncbi:MAG: YqcI/YcgG family protein [bacterium]|nr:YqcI/YcgG family protein [bacterium]